jgi:hypothetical protein
MAEPFWLSSVEAKSDTLLFGVVFQPDCGQLKILYA